MKGKLTLMACLIGLIIFCTDYTNIFARKLIGKPVSSSIVKESTKVKNSIVAFLQWYKLNLHKANSFPLLAKDSSGYYMLNKQAAGNYLNFMRSSKCVSEKYIGYWKTYFNEKADMLKNEKLTSDIPEGFDFDFVLITQEPELILNKIAQLKLNIISMNASTALVSVTLPSVTIVTYEFEMYKVKALWKIGYISTPNYD